MPHTIGKQKSTQSTGGPSKSGGGKSSKNPAKNISGEDRTVGADTAKKD